MRPVLFTSSLSLLLLIPLSIEPAVACGNGNLILEDKFQTLEPAWNFDDNVPERTNGPDGLTYKMPPQYDIDRINQAGLYENYEVCATFETEAPKDAATVVGVDFWASDLNNAYELDMAPALGTFAVFRIQKGKLLRPVPYKENAAVQTGTKTTNEVSVIVDGKKATITINGKKAIDFTGQPPEEGSLIGFNLATGKDDKGSSTVTLKSIQLRELESPSEQKPQ
jgi:hypothetical protein